MQRHKPLGKECRLIDKQRAADEAAQCPKYERKKARVSAGKGRRIGGKEKGRSACAPKAKKSFRPLAAAAYAIERLCSERLRRKRRKAAPSMPVPSSTSDEGSGIIGGGGTSNVPL